EREVDALGLLAGLVLEVVGIHVLTAARALRAGGGIAFGVAGSEVRVDPTVGDDRPVALRRRGHVEVAGEDAERLAAATFGRDGLRLVRLALRERASGGAWRG